MNDDVAEFIEKQSARSVGGQIDLLGSLDVGGTRHELAAHVRSREAQSRARLVPWLMPETTTNEEEESSDG